MKAFLRNLRGVTFLGGIAINTIFWFIPILVLSVVKLLLPLAPVRRSITRILMAIGENWVSVNGWLMRYAGSVDIQSRGVESLRRDGWYLVIANHQTWVDIVVLQAAFNRRVPFLKFFIKQQLIWFPLLGIAWWAMDMPFMKRYSPSYLRSLTAYFRVVIVGFTENDLAGISPPFPPAFTGEIFKNL